MAIEHIIGTILIGANAIFAQPQNVIEKDYISPMQISSDFLRPEDLEV